jgi:hypothetical protein
MRAYNEAFVGAMCFRFQELMPLLQQHLDDNESLLPHLFMGDVTRWDIQRYDDDATDATLLELLDFIESSFKEANIESRELVSASFLENLPRATEVGAGLQTLLGLTLTEQMRLIG